MKVLVCGSRYWTDVAAIRYALSSLPKDTIIIHGAANGADSIAGEIARELGFEERPYPANWTAHGKAAGPIRNSEMLMKEHLPGDPISHVLAFSKDFANSRGTKDMCQKSEAIGLKVYRHS